MVDFEDFEELFGDLNIGYAVTSLILSGVLAWLLFADPLDAGMAALPLWGRIGSVILCVPVMYLILQKMIE